MMMRWLCLVCLTGTMLICAGWAAAQQPVQTFTIREALGVAHPDQIIDFDLTKPVAAKTMYLIGPDGAEVPYQLLDGGKKLAVRTDLPAGAERTWKLMTGRAPAAVNTGVKVVKTDAGYEITNELIGIRLPLPQAGGQALPAPVQGVRYRDGLWTATGPNLLAIPADTGKGMTVRFLEQGPLKTVVEIAYQLERPALYAFNRENTLLVPAGKGFYRCTIEVQAGQPSLLFEEDADTDVSYSLDLYLGLEPTQARYRGHHSTSPAYGYMADRQQYSSDIDQNPAQDAFVDLQYDHPMRAIYTAGPDSYRYMAVWDPWVFNSGWYWQLYNADGPTTANLVGIFAGRASRALGCPHSGVGLFTHPNPRQAGITIALNRRSPDRRWFPRVRSAWGLFLGVKGQDLKPSAETQTVNRQMDLHGGINLNKVHRYRTAYPDPPQGYGAIYLPRAKVQQMIKRLRTDEVFHRYCYSTEPSSRPLIDLLTDVTGAKAHAAAQDILMLGRRILNTYLSGNGIHAHGYSYWEGGQTMAEKVLWIDCLLASGQLTDTETAGLKALASAFGNILWDDDFVPLFTEHGLNLAQGPVQYLGFRSFFAMYLSTQPAFKARMAGVEQMTRAALPAIINEQGAGVACPHYMGPYVATTLNVFAQLHQLGGPDYFNTEPRLKPFGEFYMHFLTPPEPRYGGVRKNIAVGNSATESSELCGVLATGFQDSDPVLSARLMGAWKASARQLDPRFGSCLLRMDFDAPATDPQLGSATFPGYYSVLRQGWGTPNETAVWFINGDYYGEHRHPGDGGEVVIYALGAPLSLDFGSMYSKPDAGEAKYHSVVQPAGRNSHMEAFATSEHGGIARATFDLAQDAKWTRAVSLTMLRDDLPVIALQDAFAGGGEKTWQLNLMADGALETPEGPRTVGQGFTIPAGVTRLGVMGQIWTAHATKGIDWDIYLVTNTPQQVEIAEWQHQWAPSVEQSQFRQANERAFEERQYLLRVKSAGPVRAFIVPHFKGQAPADLTVKTNGDTVIVSSGGKAVQFSPDGTSKP